MRLRLLSLLLLGALLGCAEKHVQSPAKHYVIRLRVTDECIQKIWKEGEGKKWKMKFAPTPACEYIEPAEETQ